MHTVTHKAIHLTPNKPTLIVPRDPINMVQERLKYLTLQVHMHMVVHQPTNLTPEQPIMVDKINTVASVNIAR